MATLRWLVRSDRTRGFVNQREFGAGLGNLTGDRLVLPL